MKFQLHQSISILERTPLLLTTWLSGVPNEWLHSNEGGNSWSPYDVIGHLIHGERTDWIVRAEIILGDKADNTFEPFDRFAQFRRQKDGPEQSMENLLKTFQVLRESNLKTLKAWNLKSEQLSLPGIHPELGPVTLGQLFACWTTHDLSHIAQIARVMGRQYKDEVGPWTSYIGILQT